MKNKQTAVDWLVENIHYLHSTKWNNIIEQAKAMEEEQIMNAWENGMKSDNGYFGTATQYYNETYK